MAKIEVPITEPVALKPEEFIVPPDWVVRLVSTNFGKAGHKYPQSWVHNYNSYPAGADEDYFPWGMAGERDDYEEHWRRMNAGGSGGRHSKTSDSPVKGNLREEEYRFWNGSACLASEVATCRWCRTWTYGHAEMRRHQEKTDHTRILREIYDYARSKKVSICFTCGARTSHEHWGIPLCSTNKCLNKWRVAPITEIGQTLLMYARLVRSKGLLKPYLNEDGSEKFNSEANPKPFNWERANAY